MNESAEQEDAGRDVFVEILQPWLDTTDIIFHEAQILIVAFDRELRYRAWNRYAEKVTGIPAEQVIGQRLVEVFPILRTIGVEALMLRALDGESCTMIPHTYKHQVTGEERLLEATYMPLRGIVVPSRNPASYIGLGSPSDSIAGVLLVGRDTTHKYKEGVLVIPMEMPKEALAGDSDLRELSRQLVAAQGQDKSVAEQAGRDPYDTLSGREREVLQHVAEGQTNAEIGTRLFISRRTVEVHRANVMRKLGLRSQAALIRYALRRNLIRLDP